MDSREADFYCDEVLSERTAVEKVLETENTLAFHHTKPYYDVHIVVIPKRHIRSLIELHPEDSSLLIELLSTIQEVAKQMTEEFGACTVATNMGQYQTNKHMHWHVHSGNRIRELDGVWC